MKHRKTLRSRRWAATTWLGLFLMLFNIANAATMGLRPMEAMANGDMPLCAEHHPGAAHHHQDPAKPGSSDSCSCCLSMCCTGAAVPDSAAPAPAPGMVWVALSFSTTASFRLHPAPRTGGSARAPPSFA
ncbi:MAG TPA: DUF2946 family protein [Magnetospirillaceae bacterium]|nr:DUF2946 family protein [Magnetospirillaceae bacterium]